MESGEKNYHFNRGEPEGSGEKNYDDPYWNDPSRSKGWSKSWSKSWNDSDNNSDDTGWDDGGYSEDSRGLIQERGDSRGSILGNTTSYNPLFLERPEKNGLYADYAEAVLEDDTRESGEKMVGNNESLTNADIYDNMLSVTTKGALL